jgi:hypothetical protein
MRRRPRYPAGPVGSAAVHRWAVPDPARESLRRAASAWQDGKSHRAFDEMPALPGADQGLAICGRYEGGLVRQPPLGTIGGCRTSLRHLSLCHLSVAAIICGRSGRRVNRRAADRIVTPGNRDAREPVAPTDPNQTELPGVTPSRGSPPCPQGTEEKGAEEHGNADEQQVQQALHDNAHDT